MSAHDLSSGGATAPLHRMLIDGQLVDSDRMYPSTNPATGEILGYAPDADGQHADAAILAARRAFDSSGWATDVDLRTRCLDQFHRALVEHVDEEVFGPVLAVIPFDDDDYDDAVRIANNSAYGLSGAVFSTDDQRALAVARRIRTGTFSINGGNYFHPDVPFGGYKQSGIGREMGVAGLEEFLECKTLAAVVG